MRRGAAQRVCAGMFDNLSQGLEKAWDMVRRDGKLTAENIKAPMREIRRALLEADVRPSVTLSVMEVLPPMTGRLLSAWIRPFA